MKSLQLTLVATVAVLSGDIRAQGESSGSPVYIRGHEVRLHADMYHSEIHLVGSEEGDNDFRRDTPALAHGHLASKMIDTEAAYRRRLAMYGPHPQDGAPWAPTPVIARPDPAAVGAASSKGEAAQRVGDEDEPMPWLLLIALAVLGLAVGWFVRFLWKS